MALTAPEITLTGATPDRVIMMIQDLDEQDARRMATDAVYWARARLPRVSGNTARRLQPISGPGWFGIWFPDAHVWFQEKGTKPFTMRSLANKVIPMWVDDVDGSLRTKNPKARTRRTEDGRRQVLIFRKAAPIGARRTTRKVNKVTGDVTTSSTPMSYPGAPGRISARTAGGGGWGGGQIAPGNGGVRWRHPGLRSSQHLNSALAETAFDSGLIIQPVYNADGQTMSNLLNQRRV